MHISEKEIQLLKKQIDLLEKQIHKHDLINF